MVPRARALFDAGLQSIEDVANSSVDVIEKALNSRSAFVSRGILSADRKTRLDARNRLAAKTILANALALVQHQLREV